MNPALSAKQDRLLDLIRQLESCAVAYSGGVDSAVVAKAAALALGDRAVAVTGVSASLAEGELTAAREAAAKIGIRHEILHTSEFDRTAYTRNEPDRCFHCKSELYTKIDEVLESLGVRSVLNGANVDDLGDYRPGLQSAREHGVRSPLVECGLNKADVRALAKHWDLPVWDKPASPCLSSRVAYGEEVTAERLAMIDKAEQFLRLQGFGELRVRYHRGDLARIEVPTTQLTKLIQPETRDRLIAEFQRLGFRFVSIDLEGFRSGSLNSLVTLDEEVSN